jgi:Fe-Mn family superoxide dismutase
MDKARRAFLQQTAAVAVGAGLAHTLHTRPAHASQPVTKAPPIVLAPLPYAQDALAPIMSAQTIALHYGKHHQGYVNNLNLLIAGTAYANLSLTEIIRRAATQPTDSAIFNNAAQIYNHDLYWQSMRPQGGGLPRGALAKAIDTQFGNYATFKERFLTAATSHFGSGWVWLTQDKAGALHIIATSNADTPLTTPHTPLMVLDVWEHAYYVDYRNVRAEYAALFLDKLVNWESVNTRIAIYSALPL